MQIKNGNAECAKVLYYVDRISKYGGKWFRGKYRWG
jgi:hypothetical protein